MPEFTIGDFVDALGGIAVSLRGLGAELSHCNADLELGKTPGKKVICQIPIFAGDNCRLSIKDGVTVEDLTETIAGLEEWIKDIADKLSTYDPSTQLSASTWPDAPGDISNA